MAHSLLIKELPDIEVSAYFSAYGKKREELLHEKRLKSSKIADNSNGTTANGNDNATNGNIYVMDANGNTTNGTSNIITGYNNVTNGNSNTIHGNGNTTNGNSNKIDGNDNITYQNSNTINGHGNSTYGDSNITIGDNNETHRNSNIIHGNGNATYGDSNSITGNFNITRGNSHTINGNGIVTGTAVAFIDNISEPEIVFSQYAQDPDEEYNEMIRRVAEERCNAIQDKTPKRRRERTRKVKSTKNFVMSRPQRRGIKLIKISVIDINNTPPTNESDSDDSENVILSAQYIVRDAVDSVMDETESLVKKISKSLVDNDF